MAPFITEELYQILKERFPSALQAPACIVAPFPQANLDEIDEQIESTFEFVDQIVYALRNIRAEMQLPPGAATDVYIIAPASDPQRRLIEENQALLQALVKINQITIGEKEKTLPFSANAMVGNLKLIIPLPEEMREKEKLRLIKEKDKLIAQQNQARTQLANNDFVQKAPKHLIEKLQTTLSQSELELSSVLQKIASIET